VVTTALNALQDTPWRVNVDVLTVMTELWRQHERPLPGIPARAPAPDVDRPVDLPYDLKKVDMSEDQVERLEAYKRERATWIDEELRRASKVLTIQQILATAQEFVEKDAFYFPFQLDWRGRRDRTQREGCWSSTRGSRSAARRQ
jgi:DNA-directed RNA polymerase